MLFSCLAASHRTGRGRGGRGRGIIRLEMKNAKPGTPPCRKSGGHVLPRSFPLVRPQLPPAAPRRLRTRPVHTHTLRIHAAQTSGPVGPPACRFFAIKWLRSFAPLPERPELHRRGNHVRARCVSHVLRTYAFCRSQCVLERVICHANKEARALSSFVSTSPSLRIKCCTLMLLVELSCLTIACKRLLRYSCFQLIFAWEVKALAGPIRLDAM